MKRAPIELSTSLEDYLKSIFGLVRANKVARVRDVALDRGVKAGSVTPALRRLAELGLINHPKHEYIELTAAGERAARRIEARHSLLSRLFGELLRMPAAITARDAHLMEHALSDEAVDRLSLLFEYLDGVPGEGERFVEGLHAWMTSRQATARPAHATRGRSSKGTDEVRLPELRPGQRAKVRRVYARGARRTHLLDLGLLPGCALLLEAVDEEQRTLRLRLDDLPLELDLGEARLIGVTHSTRAATDTATPAHPANGRGRKRRTAR